MNGIRLTESARGFENQSTEQFFHIWTLTHFSCLPPVVEISAVESQLAVCVLFHLHNVHLYLEEVGDPTPTVNALNVKAGASRVTGQGVQMRT